jgi:UDP-N-acetylmuramate--alanine ligase
MLTAVSPGLLNLYAGTLDLRAPLFIDGDDPAVAAVAQLCAVRGARVTVTTAPGSARIPALQAAGCIVRPGRDPHPADEFTCVVHACDPARPAFTGTDGRSAAPAVHWARVVHHLTTGHDVPLVAVAGTFGKTTATAMLIAALHQQGIDPTWLLGADTTTPGTNVHDGTDPLVVVDTDDTDRSFQHLRPTAALITPIGFDHPGSYTDLDDVIDAYRTFAARITHQGSLAVFADDPACRRLLTLVRRLRPDLNFVTYGTAEDADVRIRDLSRAGWTSICGVDIHRTTRTAFRLRTPHQEHVRTAAGVLALLVAMGHDPRPAAESLSAFTAVSRRFAPAGEVAGVVVIDCNAAHPHEIAADLAAARCVTGPAGRVIAVAEPSGYPRVRTFADQIAAALIDGADSTVLLDVHGPAPAVSGVDAIADRLVAAGRPVVHRTPDHVADAVAAVARPGDVVVTLGTGTVGHLTGQILDGIRNADGRYA